MAQGCLNGPSGYIGWRARTTTLCYCQQTETENLASVSDLILNSDIIKEILLRVKLYGVKVPGCDVNNGIFHKVFAVLHTCNDIFEIYN
jgi:hypothetical protein